MSDNRFHKISEDLTVSGVITGLWQIADMERNGKTLDPVSTAKSMQPYVEAGFTTFDMADHYGSAEIIAGTFGNSNVLGTQGQYLTKWVPQPGKVTKDEIRAAVELAMRRLQTDKLHLLQYHAWNYADPAWMETLFVLQELIDEGLIGHLGVTNFDAAHLRVAVASGIPIVTNQVSYSLLDQRASGEMKEVCEQYGVKVLAYGTIAGGLLSEKWMGVQEPKQEELKTWSQMKYKRFLDQACDWNLFQELLKVLSDISGKHGISMANVATKFIMDQEHVASVILGARLGESEHIQENQKLYEFELDQEDLEKIESVRGEFHSIPGDCGDEYRKPPFLTASGDLSHHLDNFPSPYEAFQKENGRIKVQSGTYWEEMAGYCRAVKSGDRIMVSGTTATLGDRMIGGSDPKAQAHFVLDKIEGSIQALGGTLEDVDRTRIFVNDVNDWEPVARAHGERFKDIQPANTLVEARLVGEGYLVEIEAEARVQNEK